jgi:tetratricopeptide (TPR) repeat protein/transcription elongation GreA/GreB family factor
MLSGGATPLGRHDRVVELRFQAGVHKYKTDDLVCTLRDDTGAERKALLQCKSDVRAVASDTNFVESLTAAWLDFQNPECFTPNRDSIYLVYASTGGGSLQALEKLMAFAHGSTSATDFLQKATAHGFSNQSNRNTLSVVRDRLDIVAGRSIGDEELWSFLYHWKLLRHDLLADDTQEAVQHVNTIGQILGVSLAPNPWGVWSEIVGACSRFNANADTVTRTAMSGHMQASVLQGFETLRAGGVTLPVESLTSSALAAPPKTDLDPVLPTARVPTVAADAKLDMNLGLPAALPASVNKLVTAHLDSINAKVKAGRYRDALSELTTHADMALFDDHQRARWYLMRGACYWSEDHMPEAASDFLRAAELFPDEDKMAAGKVRGLALKHEFAAAVSAANAATERFPDSAYIWASWGLAKVLAGQPIALEDFPLSRRQDADVLQLVAWSKRGQKDWSAAVDTALKAVAATDSAFPARNAALAVVLEAVTDSPVVSTFRLLDDLAARSLRTVVAAFEPRTEKLWSLQSPDAQSRAASHLAIAYALFNEHATAMDIVREAKAHGVTTPNLVRVELECLAETGPYEVFRARAVAAMGQLAEDGLVALAQAGCNNADLGLVDAVLDASKVLQGRSARASDALQGLRWTAVWNSGRRADAVAAVEAAAIDSSESLVVLVAGTRLLLKSAEPKRLAALLRKAEQLANTSDTLEDRMLVADLMFDAKRFAQAADQLKRLLPRGQHSEMHNRWLWALVRAGNWRAAKDLLDSFPPHWIHDERARALAIELGNSAGDVELLRKLANVEFERSPDQAASWIFRHTLDLQTMSLVELRDRLAPAPLHLKGSIRELTQLAAEELRLGLDHQGMRRLYRMRRLNAAAIESASALFMAFTTAHEHLPDMEESLEFVQAGSHVRLIDADGVTVNVTIDPPEVGDLPSTTEFRAPAAPEVSRMLGKKSGDEVTVPQSFGGARTYRVQAIQSAYRRLIEVAMEDMQTSVAPIPNMAVMHMRTGPDGVDFGDMLDQLKRQSAHVRQVFEAYQKGSITLGILAMMLGRDTIELVRGWGSAGMGQSLQVCIGRSDERMQALQLLADRDEAYVIDAATLAELAMLEVGAVLGLLAKVYISAETQAAVLRSLELAKRDRSSGRTFERDGQLGFVEVTPEQHAKNVAFLQQVADLMDKYCEVTPVYGPEAMAPEVAKLLRVLPNEDRQVLLLASEKGVRLFSIDFRLRNIAVLMGVQGVWPQPVLMYATQAGGLTGALYTKAIAHMFIGNRAFISIGAKELAFICHQGTPWLRFGMAKLMAHLRDPEADYSSAVTISCDFVEFLMFNTCTYMGAVAELLKHIVESLLRHPASGGNLPERLIDFFKKVFVGEHSGFPHPLVAEWDQREDAAHRQFFADAIREGAVWAAGPDEQRPIQVNALMCGVTPWLVFDDDKEDKSMPEGIQSPTGEPAAAVAEPAGDANSQTIYLADEIRVLGAEPGTERGGVGG